MLSSKRCRFLCVWCSLIHTKVTEIQSIVFCSQILRVENGFCSYTKSAGPQDIMCFYVLLQFYTAANTYWKLDKMRLLWREWKMSLLQAATKIGWTALVVDHNVHNLSFGQQRPFVGKLTSICESPIGTNCSESSRRPLGSCWWTRGDKRWVSNYIWVDLPLRSSFWQQTLRTLKKTTKSMKKKWWFYVNTLPSHCGLWGCCLNAFCCCHRYWAQRLHAMSKATCFSSVPKTNLLLLPVVLQLWKLVSMHIIAVKMRTHSHVAIFSWVIFVWVHLQQVVEHTV